jgi:hypothetical protein
MDFRARIRDWLHERRISRLYRAHVDAVRRGAPFEVRYVLWREFAQAVAERSPEAVARMERRKGLT